MEEIEQTNNIIFVEKSDNTQSKQVKDPATKGAIDPPINFRILQMAYDDSFILGGVFDKLSTAGNTGFKETKNAELDAVLSTLDLKYIFENILVYGNTFIEKVMDGRGKVVELSTILTYTINVWRMGQLEGYLQRISGREHFFLPEEVIHCKTTSMMTKDYGDSKFSKAVEQIVLLSQIDQYYSSMFNRGMIGSCLLVDKGDKDGKKMSDENRKQLTAWLQDNAAGLQKSFKTAIVPTDLAKLDLDKDMDTEAFLKYRADLIESIAISLNIPVDLLTSKNSNRSTSEVAFETLNALIVKPMQDSFVQDLRENLRKEFGNAVDSIEIISSDTQDEEKDMKIYTGYKKAGIMTANEVREKLGLPTMEGGDLLVVDAGKPDLTPAQDVIKEMEEIRKTFNDSVYGDEK